MCDVISDAAADEEEAIGWMFPSSGDERAKTDLSKKDRSTSNTQKNACGKPETGPVALGDTKTSKIAIISIKMSFI